MLPPIHSALVQVRQFGVSQIEYRIADGSGCDLIAFQLFGNGRSRPRLLNSNHEQSWPSGCRSEFRCFKNLRTKDRVSTGKLFEISEKHIPVFVEHEAANILHNEKA